ncbi:uncharacterized protein LOC123562171 [Mercenaria mercenaria]|uniref:uncharacterized protein LOC123562171 n=1 Tax=Mercenaria mercenaria TaxID=6596 RepID=UPI00234F9F22|nr:uncharacterized protein LOC123562171 [Mercenaria mercenaria]
MEEFCPLHRRNHSLNKCRAFKSKSISERKQFLKNNRICFKCCDSNRHQAKECRISVKCSDCGSSNHTGAMHVASSSPPQQNGGEREGTNDTVHNKCTQICGNGHGKSCAKFVLVNVFSSENPSIVVKCYAMLDEQSNRSLVKPELFTLLDIDSQEFEYTLNSCAGTHVTRGRRASNCVIQSVDGSVSYDLPTLIECSDIPNNREEICSPHDASCHPHLSPIAGYIPDIDDKAEILLLIGRDLVEAHHVNDQVLGPPGAPFAQKLGLGWVVIGEVCIGKVHARDQVNVNKTQILNNGRPSLFQPCSNRFVLDERVCSLYDPVFVQEPNDDKSSFSVEDREFLSIMDNGFKKTTSGKWAAPLPFKTPRQRLPNNKSEALRRAKFFHTSLQKNPEKKEHMTEFMGKILLNGHAEVAPDLLDGEECWYLPIFGVYNSKKPGKIRGVFDSSAAYQGVSLNSVLLTGPDLTNNLLGVLMRFRRELVAVAADIEQMFYCFEVNKEHRNFLRFLWYQDNDTEKPLIEYRMCRHVFGNSPSPAIATYGLRKSVENSEEDVKDFVYNDFYVDDGLMSRSCPEEAVDLMKRSQVALRHSSLRLHKVASNDVEVMKCFPVDDLAKDLRSLNFEKNLPMQRSLGLEWDLNSDSFVFVVETPHKTPTRRNVLSTVNSVFDPIGFLAPFTIVGKLILRDIVTEHSDWDKPLSTALEAKCLHWKNLLHPLSSLQIPRSYFSVSLRVITDLELHVFCDASEQAISAVAYLVGHTNDWTSHVAFVMGKSKVAPTKGHTIPRLELCGAVLAVDIAQTIVDQLRLELSLIKYYTDSRIVLGYIHNQTRRFFTYVSNRIQKIRRVSEPKQWNYISSNVNPADIGSRGASPDELQRSSWFLGPTFLRNQSESIPEFFPIVDPDQDKEVRCNVSVNVASIEVSEHLGSSRFEKFSSWSKLVAALSTLRHVACSYCSESQCKGWHRCPLSKSPDFQLQTECLIFKVIQGEVYKNEVICLKGHRNIERDSSILALDPYLDEHCVLRVGGRLSRSSLESSQKHPVIVPGKHYVAKLLVNHFHTLVQHQGRQLTEGAVRDAGFWITGGKRLVSSQIYNCITCKKLRGRFLEQKMSDLPVDRVKQAAPFSYVGVDVFGPWSVVCRRTRGGQASSKRWAVLFTCLTIRAIHIEVIDEMSSSAFINALRRFISIRGKVKQFRSDRGTNFVGATDHLNIDAVNVEDEKTRAFLYKQGCVWVFNAPHSSHMGGSWERMIGIARRILESMLAPVKTLTHDVLVTFMAEVSAIVNSRPIVSVSNDPDKPEILSPSTLLTSKIDCDISSYGNLDIKALYREQWKRVQYLAEQFWLRWRREYLNSLQKRQKWNYEKVPIEVGDIVLLKDSDSSRNCWPMGKVSKIFPSVDNRVRKVEVIVHRDGKLTSFTRPIVELVLLVKAEH